MITHGRDSTLALDAVGDIQLQLGRQPHCHSFRWRGALIFHYEDRKLELPPSVLPCQTAEQAFQELFAPERWDTDSNVVGLSYPRMV